MDSPPGGYDVYSRSSNLNHPDAMQLAPTELIINYTPTGLIPTRDMTPHVPLSVPEIVDDVLAANDKGITMAHLHARSGDGEPSLDADTYAAMIEGIRRHAPELILCVSLSGRFCNDVEERARPLDLDGPLRPDMASLTLSSLNFNRNASVNTPEAIRTLAERMLHRRIRPELEAFDTGMLNYLRYLGGKGLLPGRPYVNLIVGNIASAQPTLLHMGMMIHDLPENAIYSLGGVGNCQAAVHGVAVAMAHGVRVGLEDNIWFDPGRTRLATNMDLLERVHLLAEQCGRTPMVPATCRTLLGLAPGHGRYGVATEDA